MHSGDICSHRLLTKNMFPSVDCGFEMHRAKSGRRGKKHDIHPAINHFLICIEPDETVFGRHFHFIPVFSLEAFQAGLEMICKSIAHRGEDDVWIRFERLVRRARTPSAAANQANAERIGVFFGEKFPRQNCRRRQSAARRVVVAFCDGSFISTILTQY